MDTLANNAVTGTAVLTSTPISTINSCNLTAKVSRLAPQDISNRLNLIRSNPEHYKFNEYWCVIYFNSINTINWSL
jgi:hypothetical protein